MELELKLSLRKNLRICEIIWNEKSQKEGGGKCQASD